MPEKKTPQSLGKVALAGGVAAPRRAGPRLGASHSCAAVPGLRQGQRSTPRHAAKGCGWYALRTHCVTLSKAKTRIAAAYASVGLTFWPLAQLKKKVEIKKLTVKMH
mgnify:CR=1 FL=1